MPLFDDALENIRFNLEKLQIGDKVGWIEIGYFTDIQFSQINFSRRELNLHPLEQNQILFIGRHLYNSRHADGYTVDDMIDQIASALSINSVVSIYKSWSLINSSTLRSDKYGNLVKDQGVLEMTARRPKAELFSVVPKGDKFKPSATKKPT